jgi:hypothetical protein
MGKPRFSLETRQRFRKLYEAGETWVDIAVSLGVSLGTIHYWRTAMKLPDRETIGKPWKRVKNSGAKIRFKRESFGLSWWRECQSETRKLVSIDRAWAKHPEILKSAALDRYYRDHESSKKRQNELHRANRPALSARAKERRRSDPLHRIKENLRRRLNKIIHQGLGKKIGTSSLIGCSWKYLIAHITPRLTPGMTWENYGTVWQIDHVLPCASFDLTKRAQVKKCFHYTNLQPLLSSANASKKAKMLRQLDLFMHIESPQEGWGQIA